MQIALCGGQIALVKGQLPLQVLYNHLPPAKGKWLAIEMSSLVKGPQALEQIIVTVNLALGYGAQPHN